MPDISVNPEAWFQLLLVVVGIAVAIGGVVLSGRIVLEERKRDSDKEWRDE